MDRKPISRRSFMERAAGATGGVLVGRSILLEAPAPRGWLRSA